MLSQTFMDRFVEDWCTRDRSRAFVKTDLEVIESTATVRVLAAEHLLRSSAEPHEDAAKVDRDLLHAFGLLGRLVGERGGSPTLAVAIVDGARQALQALETVVLGVRTPDGDPPWVMLARAAVAEGFAAARQEAARAEAATRWEFPRCAVGVEPGIVAIAAGYPEDDLDALLGWASRVAGAAAFASVRRVIFSGSPAAEAALAEALDIAGIQRISALPIRGGRRADHAKSS